MMWSGTPSLRQRYRSLPEDQEPICSEVSLKFGGHGDAVRWAERIMNEIDRRWPVKAA